MSQNIEAVRSFLQKENLEESFLKATGLSSLDELHPKNFSEFSLPNPPTVTQPAAPSAPIPHRQLPKSAADASTGFMPKSASDMLKPYVGLNINYKAKKTQSSYSPCSLMMDYIVHIINDLLVDNFYFRRACPDYHPYILRLYYAVLFWIQCLRAGNYARMLDVESHQALVTFVDAFPPETLPISGPLVDLFKTLCCSQPEIPNFGMVFPAVPAAPGPDARSSFIKNDVASHLLPNIPGIFALIEHLNSKLNPADPAQAIFPAKGKHIPVERQPLQATIFGHYPFPQNNRTDAQRWSLVSSGLQHPCEADKKLHENFAERIDNFQFPRTAAEDDLSSIHSFLHIDHSLAWFAHVRDVASAEASFFEGSGTLADCPPYGMTANQIIVEYQRPPRLPTAPNFSADPESQFPFSIRLKTNARQLPELSEAMAALAQTNVEIFNAHPYYGTFGPTTRHGPFWDIRPNETSFRDDTSFLSLREIVRGLMKPKG
ncbi:capsid protein [Rose partitivirus]|nr:capsid protein [Rose partitivirus]WDE20755.1 capsid protein [Rose partitivirus]